MLVERRYNRENALAYARRWALERNPLFYNYTGQGGDCTNFISQCLFAGSCEMNFTPVFGWFYLDSETRTASWTGVEFFYNFITSNSGTGPFAVEVGENMIDIGDVVQPSNRDGDWYHTLFVTDVSPTDGILIAAHSDDALDRPLASYNYASARFLHIVGVRFNLEFESGGCFDALINGERIEP